MAAHCVVPRRAVLHHALVLARCMEAHSVMPRGVTWYHASVISRGRDDTAEGVQEARKKPWCVFLRDTTLRFRDTT